MLIWSAHTQNAVAAARSFSRDPERQVGLILQLWMDA